MTAMNVPLISYTLPIGAIAPDDVEAAPVRLEVPQQRHFQSWAALRARSREALQPFEPRWSDDDLERSGFKRRLRRYQHDRRHGLGAAFFITRQEDGELVGGCNLNNIMRGVRQSASVGYWSGLGHRRMGYVRAALHGIIAYGFGPLGLHRIEAACLPHNEGSLRLLRSVGFHQEGLARDYLKIDEQWQDHVLLAHVHDPFRPHG